MHALRIVLCCLALCAMLGCGSSGVQTVPVEGKVTFAGGPPPKPGNIVFNPLGTADGLPRRPGRAQFDAQGNFRVSSFSPNDGLIPGSYQPVIFCWKAMPSDELGSVEAMNYVPQDFEAPELQVKQEQSEVEVNYDVPLKK